MSSDRRARPARESSLSVSSTRSNARVSGWSVRSLPDATWLIRSSANVLIALRAFVKPLFDRRPFASTAYVVTLARLATSMTWSSLAESAGVTGSPSEKKTIVLRPGKYESDCTTAMSASAVSYPLCERSRLSNDRTMFSSVLSMWSSLSR